MLKRYFSAPADEGCALLLGGFDGFHLGHMRLLEEAEKTGLPVGLTSFFGGKTGGELFTSRERDCIFSRLGFSFCIKERFTQSFRELPAKTFLKNLFSNLNVKAVFCGEDFRFGANAEGTVSLLKELSPCPVTVLPHERAGGEKISTTRLKELVREGKTEELNRLLAFGYLVEGVAEHGRGVGHTLGFPTVNLRFAKGKLHLREGVYAGKADTVFGTYPAIVNVGPRPTFGIGAYGTEAHLKGFSGNLYGTRVCVYPQKFLRPIQSFSSREELIAQLMRDLESTEDC